MPPLHQDMMLTEEQKSRVLRWVEETGFTLPGAQTRDFSVRTRARYLGFLFTHEDLEAFAVGLRCTKPGMADARTSIRMSRGQLLGEPDAPTFEPHPPVTAAEAMTMHRWRSRGYRSTGGAGVPGIDLDLAMLEDYLSEILGFGEAHGADTSAHGWYELSVQWGVLLAGRLPRVEHFANLGALTSGQAERLEALRGRAEENRAVLHGLELPQLRASTGPRPSSSGGGPRSRRGARAAGP